jgi:hypothetical protein
MQTCRFCKSHHDIDHMIKYGVRHYAHFDCYLDAGKPLQDLHDWQIIAFPARLIKDRGLMAIAQAAYERERAANPAAFEVAS